MRSKVCRRKVGETSRIGSVTIFMVGLALRGRRLPALALRLGVGSGLGPAENVLRVAVREPVRRDAHALEVGVEHDREPRLDLPPSREGPLGRIALRAVRRRAGMEREGSFLDDALAGPVERVAEEHQLVGVHVEMGVGGRDLEGMPSRHHGDEGTEGEAAVRDVPDWNVWCIGGAVWISRAIPWWLFTSKT